jgi:hypothetical protein
MWPQDAERQAGRPQNTPSAGRLAPRPPAPRGSIADAIARARELNERQADQLGHYCAVHTYDEECDGSPFCHSYCGRKLPPDFATNLAECVLCRDLMEGDL